jgi:small subunit ribosomal protein S13
MARILGVEIPDNKNLEISLTYIYGVGEMQAKKIIQYTRIDGNKKVKDLSEEELGKIASFLQKNMVIEGDLKKELGENVRRLIEINSYRGARHRHSLPVRGQRTRSNARTRKGPKKTVGIIRDKTQRKTLKSKMQDTDAKK